MTPRRRLGAALAVLALVTIVGVIGLMVIEGLSFVDAIYMVVITITTVGFREVGGEPGTAGKVLTMFIMVTGVGTALYTAGIGLEIGLEALLGGQREQRRMEEQIRRMRDHVILCGWGRVGRTAWEELTADDGTDVVVIENDTDAVERAREIGATVILGDATHDHVLEEAGIDRARTLISAVRADSDNLVIALSAKAKRPDLYVVARAVDSETEKKLFLAGADRVVAPQRVGGQRLAALAMKPDLAEFIDLVVSGRTVEFRVEEFIVDPSATIVGQSIRDLDLRRRAGALILAVGDTHGRLSLNPDPELVFKPGQSVVAIGTAEQLDALRGLVAVA